MVIGPVFFCGRGMTSDDVALGVLFGVLHANKASEQSTKAARRKGFEVMVSCVCIESDVRCGLFSLVHAVTREWVE